MNQLNYGSLEACQRLVQAGIVLETEEVWSRSGGNEWHLEYNSDSILLLPKIPAPSMAEVWRELPEELSIRHCTYSLRIYRYKGRSHAGYQFYEDVEVMKDSVNPTDALIDLLIWVKGEKG
jgi:hypothetical protein